MIRQSLLIVALPAALVAQPASLTPGDRVRVRVESGQRFTGRLLVPIRDSLAIERRRGGALNRRIDSLRVATSSITTLEVSRGLAARPARGALIGAIAGAALGVLLGTARADTPFEGIVSIGVIGGALGAVGGAIIGLSPTERWERIVP